MSLVVSLRVVKMGFTSCCLEARRNSLRLFSFGGAELKRLWLVFLFLTGIPGPGCAVLPCCKGDGVGGFNPCPSRRGWRSVVLSALLAAAVSQVTVMTCWNVALPLVSACYLSVHWVLTLLFIYVLRVDCSEQGFAVCLLSG